jgi:D-3-phosphoglycerate dehydrogenase
MFDDLRILLAEKSSFSQKGINALTQLGATDAHDLSQSELLKRIDEYDILVVRLGLRVNAAVLEATDRLKTIVTPTTGTDHIDLETARKSSVDVISLKGEREFLDQVYATAEHSFALLMSVLRFIPASFDSVKESHWQRDKYRGRELHGKSLGLVGCGRLGNMMVRYGNGFGMHVLAYDPYLLELPDSVERCDNLDDLLPKSDIISLHVPLNNETLGMISTHQFATMRTGAILVNTSRGAIVDEKALLHALESGRLAGAALDVICDEHLIENGKINQLIDYSRNHDNLVITPHIGGATYESVEKADLFVIDKLQEYLSGRGLEKIN